MPRKANARLEGRILDAAYHIWSRRGEHALTMRAVASASGTTTPTLYERFSNKEDLLSLLRRRARMNLFSAIKSSRTPAHVCRGVLDFFLAHPNDYRLITEDWATAFARKEEMPSFESLVAILHGTATLLHSADVHQKISRDFRRACIRACEALIRAASANRSHSNYYPQGTH